MSTVAIGSPVRGRGGEGVGVGMIAMAEKQAPPTSIRAWRCIHCGYVLGHIANGIFHEDDGDKSGFPIVRRCPDCHRRNVKLVA